MYFSGFFQTDSLITFSFAQGAETITWVNFIQAKWDPGSTKEGCCLDERK